MALFMFHEVICECSQHSMGLFQTAGHHRRLHHCVGLSSSVDMSNEPMEL